MVDCKELYSSMVDLPHEKKMQVKLSRHML